MTGLADKVLEDNDKISESGGEDTVPETGAAGNLMKRRGPGRPPGSRNKVSASARELLATEGIAGIKALCKFAAGKTVYRPIAGGAREKLVPDINQMLSAQRAILDCLVPTLKAQEITGRDGEPLLGNADTPTDSRQVGRLFIHALRTVPPAWFVLIVDGTYRRAGRVANDERLVILMDAKRELHAGPTVSGRNAILQSQHAGM